MFFNPAIETVASALISRSSPNPLLPYYLALASQVLASLYAFLFIPETLPNPTSSPSSTSSSLPEEEHTYGEEVIESVVAPVRPLALLLPHKDDKGRWRWRLSLLTISLLTTTCGVSIAIVREGS
jgi:hypothetical protein